MRRWWTGSAAHLIQRPLIWTRSTARSKTSHLLEGEGSDNFADHRTFLLEYTYAGQSLEVKQQIVDMALNASGIRDTARVLHVSPTTVLNELKKRNRTCKR